MKRTYKGRPSKYRKSLQKNEYWEKVKEEVKKRDGYKCRLCKSRVSLEIHHKTYKVNGTSIVGRELEFLDCLVCLCAGCHIKAHKGSVNSRKVQP